MLRYINNENSAKQLQVIIIINNGNDNNVEFNFYNLYRALEPQSRALQGCFLRKSSCLIRLWYISLDGSMIQRNAITAHSCLQNDKINKLYFPFLLRHFRDFCII